jgi:hypothetical protein
MIWQEYRARKHIARKGAKAQRRKGVLLSSFPHGEWELEKKNDRQSIAGNCKLHQLFSLRLCVFAPLREVLPENRDNVSK